jgi:ABC-2 type transport system ATP-binding protein
MIEVKDIKKRFTNKRLSVDAVCGVSFQVDKGEIYGLLGPNGAGKSTTIQMLATLLAPTSGTATIGTYDIKEEPQTVRRVIGLALQETGLDKLLSAREILLLHSRLYGLLQSSGKRAQELIELVGLEEAGDRQIKTYSGGMRRRLDLALALVHKPAVLFLDEPTTGLDPASRRQIWEEIEKLRDQGITILLTTQYLEEADQLANRVGIIDEGVLVAEGTPEALKKGLGGDVIEVTLPEDKITPALAALEGASVSDNRIYLTVDDGAIHVPKVAATLQTKGIQPQALAVHRPTLDDVFLQLTGRRLEGEDESKHEQSQNNDN